MSNYGGARPSVMSSSDKIKGAEIKRNIMND